MASATYHNESHGPDQNWADFPVVKTHLLPDQLPEELLSRKLVYLIRDGRDAAVSLAHHRKDVIEPNSSYEQNLEAVTYAAEGSHFGGWSSHVKTWVPKADLIIRFSDLIKDPIGQCERLRVLFDLPLANPEKLPQFEDLKSGKPEYGSGKYLNQNLAKHWFRKGKVNGWMQEMTEEQHQLFWHLHGETMEVFGYHLDGSNHFNYPLLSVGFREKAGLLTSKVEEREPRKVLVEASKLADIHFDGIKRYVFQLLQSVNDFTLEALELSALVQTEELSVSEALEREGAGHESIERGFFYYLKELLKMLLPKSMYNQVAKQFPLAKVRRWFTFNWSTKAEEKESTLYDSALLTLPQNYLYLEPFKYSQLLTVVHDLTHHLVPKYHEENNILRTQEGLDFAAKFESTYISVSSNTQNDLHQIGIESQLALEGVDRTKFFPVANQHLLQLVRERYSLPEGKFLLSVSTLEPRKNIRRLVAAYCKLPHQIRKNFPLVLAGKKGWKWKEVSIPDDCKSQIHFTGFIREDHLPALYTLAYGFCYVSQYEGFGLPVLEAMACGCPALVSDNTSLPELIGDAGILCNPSEVDSIQMGIMRLIEKASDDTFRKDALMQTWQFTWAKHWEGIAKELLN